MTPAHFYIEVPLQHVPGITFTVDLVGNARIRANVRDLSETAVAQMMDNLRNAGDQLRQAAEEVRK